MTPASRTTRIKSRARELGFDLVGVCAAVTPTGFSRLVHWLNEGYAGQMAYLLDRLPAYEHPDHVLSGVRSLVMLGMHYRTVDPQPAPIGFGRISRYAWGSADYHDVIHVRLRKLRLFVQEMEPCAQVRGVVDTAPLLEREFAQLAGLGWIGKNTMLINKRTGSWFFLASLLTDLELEYDAPHTAAHCGTCRACLDACPTQAFSEPYVLDANRCISYLTIELREAIPPDVRSALGDWLFGCDICQEVCPWNRFAPTTDEPVFFPGELADPVDLSQLFAVTGEDFRRRFRRTPLWRSRRRGVLRNAAIALGNQGAASGASALMRGLQDNEPLVRAACAWALGRIEHPGASSALSERLTSEMDRDVQREIQAALDRPGRD